MGISQYVRFHDLPNALRSALDEIHYAKPDIAVETRTEVSLQSMGSDGRQSFAVIVDLESGKRAPLWGSWGGPNAYSSESNAVDSDGRQHALPVNGAVILGSRGNGVYARLVVHPDNLAKLLPSDAAELPIRERYVLHVYRGIKSSSRNQYLGFIRGRAALVDSLVARGYLKRNASGATQITTEGKNAAGDGNADRFRYDVEKMERAS